MTDTVRAVSPLDDFREIGDVSIEVWRKVLADAASPLLPVVDGCWAACKGHTLLALSVAYKETALGKQGMGPRIKNALGLMASDGSTLLSFERWEDGFAEFARRIRDVNYKGGVYPDGCNFERYTVTYVGGPRCFTSRGKECANGETWAAPETASINLYLQQGMDRMTEWRKLEQTLQQPVPPAPVVKNPFPTPKLYDLSANAATFALSSACVAKIRSNKFAGRPYGVKGIVLHIQEGTSKGSLGWWCNGPNVQASSSVMTQHDGSVLRIIYDTDGPWTNGDVQNPTARGRQLLSKVPNVNPNRYTVTLEAEGYSKDPMGEAQIQAICWMCAQWLNRHNLKISDIYRHSDINSVTRANCPGGYFDEVIKRLTQAAHDHGLPWI
jgi:hypothetical protein